MATATSSRIRKLYALPVFVYSFSFKILLKCLVASLSSAGELYLRCPDHSEERHDAEPVRERVATSQDLPSE